MLTPQVWPPEISISQLGKLRLPRVTQLLELQRCEQVGLTQSLCSFFFFFF